MKKKILILANSSAGLYSFRKELILRLREYGEVYASIPDDGHFEDVEALGCHVIKTDVDRRGIDPVKDLRLVAFYRKLVRQVEPDLVITYTIKPNVYGGLVCRGKKIPYAVNITGLGTAFQKRGILRALVTKLYRMALKKAKIIFFENETNRQIFLDKKICREEKTCLLNGAGVNLERYAVAPYPMEEPVRFLFMGRVMQEKGINELFAAMERLRSEGASCCLDVLGGYEEDYADTIRRYEAQGWLRYHGYQSDVRPFIEKAHCFVLPSYHEGMANTNLECAAMGRPLITSNIPGCREAVVEGESGILCEAKSADSLYAAMERFLKLPLETRREMGLAGRQHMEAVFDKKQVVEQTVKGLGLIPKPKKICLITTVSSTTRSFIIPIAQYYRANTDWEICIMCDPDPTLAEDMPEGVRYIPVSMKRGISIWGIAALDKMKRVFKREKFDLIQYCTPNAAFYASVAGKCAKVPVRLYCQWGMVYVSMKGLKRRIFKAIEKSVCSRSTWIEPDSFGNLEYSHQVGLYPEDKGSVVWNGSTGGIDLQKFDLSKKALWRQQIRQKHGVPQDAVVFGFVGRITRDKGINELYEAFRELLKTYPDAYLMMIGRIEKARSVRADLVNWADQEPHVVFCGSTDIIEQYFAALDVHVLPSYREGFGSVIIEAEAMEVPIITTAIPGPLESMCPDVTGLSVPKQDAKALHEAMVRLYQDEQLRETFGKAGRRYVAERFEVQRFYAETLADRKRLLGEME